MGTMSKRAILGDHRQATTGIASFGKKDFFFVLFEVSVVAISEWNEKGCCSALGDQEGGRRNNNGGSYEALVS